jgi:hypothetical protein
MTAGNKEPRFTVSFKVMGYDSVFIPYENLELSTPESRWLLSADYEALMSLEMWLWSDHDRGSGNYYNYGQDITTVMGAIRTPIPQSLVSFSLPRFQIPGLR